MIILDLNKITDCFKLAILQPVYQKMRERSHNVNLSCDFRNFLGAGLPGSLNVFRPACYDLEKLYCDESIISILHKHLIEIQKQVWKMLISQQSQFFFEEDLISRAVAGLIVLVGQDFHFLHFSLNFDKFFFSNLSHFLLHFGPSEQPTRPPGKALSLQIKNFLARSFNLSFFPGLKANLHSFV